MSQITYVQEVSQVESVVLKNLNSRDQCCQLLTKKHFTSDLKLPAASPKDVFIRILSSLFK